MVRDYRVFQKSTGGTDGVFFVLPVCAEVDSISFYVSLFFSHVYQMFSFFQRM